MSRTEDPRQEVRERLAWLDLLGVKEIVGRAPASAPPRQEGSPTPPGQVGLFGHESPDELSKPGRGRRRMAGNRTAGESLLLGAVAPEAPDASSALTKIKEDLGDCRRCGLCEKRTNIVFGVGSPDARLMFIGEGPGADEDRQGEPFVGRAGQLLTKIIEAMGISRPDVYIANIVKCRPPDNRTPLPDEVSTCSPFLAQQVAAIRPQVIVCLGTPAAQTILGSRETITRIRGSFREVNGIQVMPTFHPAYLLRNPAAKREVWEDMKQVMALLKLEG